MDISADLTLTLSSFHSTSSSLSSILESLSSLAKRLEIKAKELDEKEGIVTQREENIKYRIMELERGEMRMRSQEVYLEHMLKQLKEREKNWATIQKRIEGNVSKVADSVKLNVGGHMFATTKGTLLKHKGSFFSSLVQSGSMKDEEIFIDRDPSEFGVILNFMRDGRMRKIKDQDEFFFECSFFGLFPFEFLSSSFQDSLRSWLPGKQFSLIYQATRDGFRTADFHRQCDKKGFTLTIISSKEGFLFGCFSPDDWHLSSSKSNPDSFVFTLSNPLSIPPTRYFLSPRGSSSSPPSSVSSPSQPPTHGRSHSNSSPPSPHLSSSPSPALNRSLSPTKSPPSTPLSPTSARRTAVAPTSPTPSPSIFSLSQNIFSPSTPQNTVVSSSSILAPSILAQQPNIFSSSLNLSSPVTPPKGNNIRRKTMQWEEAILPPDPVLKFSGDAFFLSSLSDTNSESSINFPQNFVDTTGQGWKTFTGEKQFSTQEIIVFSVQ